MVSEGRTAGPSEGLIDDVISVTVGPKPSLGAMDGVVGDRGVCTISEGVSIDAYKGADEIKHIISMTQLY